MLRTIGVLALQGDFGKHVTMLRTFQAQVLAVRKPEELRRCDGLIIPGGESTTLTKLMTRDGFYDPLREFGQQYPVMGTCAGMIMVAANVDDSRVQPLDLIDIAVQRNAYGRQQDSFITTIASPRLNARSAFRAIFIRAPQIQATGIGVETLMEWQGQPVMVRNERVLALAFHPELTDDPTIHQYFLTHF